MRVYTESVYSWDPALKQYVLVHEEWEEYEGPVALCDRAAQAAAKNAGATAAKSASKYDQAASTELAPLQQFDIQNLTNPQGYGQKGITSMLTAAMGGTGGGSGAMEGAVTSSAAAQHNLGGGSSALMDSIARAKMKGLASANAGIAAQNEDLKQRQRAGAAADLSGLYGTNVGAGLNAQKIRTGDINAQIEAGKSGWLQNAMNIAKTVTGGFADVMTGINQGKQAGLFGG